MTTKTPVLKTAFKAAFPYTIPIFAGFWFLGLAYGVFMNVSGFSFWYPMLMSLTIFAGSLQFLMVNLLLGAFSPLQTLAVALMVQARHLFYGISMLDNYRGMGRKKPYLIFGLIDETFSINYTAAVPEGVDKGWFMFFVTVLNHLYWFSGSTIGGLVGSMFTFNTQGLEFAMTSMFLVIFIEQLLKEKAPYTALIGLGASVAALVLFGANRFLLPAMGGILGLLTLLRKPIERGGLT